MWLSKLPSRPFLARKRYSKTNASLSFSKVLNSKFIRAISSGKRNVNFNLTKKIYYIHLCSHPKIMLPYLDLQRSDSIHSLPSPMRHIHSRLFSSVQKPKSSDTESDAKPQTRQISLNTSQGAGAEIGLRFVDEEKDTKALIFIKLKESIADDISKVRFRSHLN